jgi:hypothetical protein
VKKTVMCIAQSESHAKSLVQKLQSAGFSSQDISVVLPIPDVTKDHRLGRPVRTRSGGADANPGDALGLAAPVAELTITEMGPLVAAGPLLTALSGTAGEPTIDCLIGAFVRMGILEDEAKLYASKVQAGSLLIAVDTHAGDEPRRAAAIFMGARGLALRVTGEAIVPRTEPASVGARLDG